MVDIDDAPHEQKPEVRIQVHLPPPGSPPRSWDAVPAWIASTELDLIVQMSESAEALRRLAGGEPLNDSDVAALGRLNFAAHLQYFVPVAALMPNQQLLNPAVARLLTDEHPVPEVVITPAPPPQV